ncbi:MAG TPA: hypothetical protein VMV12_06755 [Candidatus Micrarchaeaceae archaeon]|nr:hypothetical protein [Candidatus Micrarchaeaceae archaeon]
MANTRSLTVEHILTLSLLTSLFGLIATAVAVTQRSWTAAILTGVGGALLSAGAVSFLWNLLAERWTRAERERDMHSLYGLLEAKLQATQEAFLRTHYEIAEGSESFGLTNIMLHRLRSTEVRTGLDCSQHFLMVCIIDSDWRDRYFADLAAMIRRGGIVDVYMPDPSDPKLMSEISRRFQRPVAQDVAALQESLEEITRETTCVEASGRITIHLLKTMPSYTCYRFEGADGDDRTNFGMIRLYGNIIKRGNSLPALKFIKQGLIWQFVTSDVEAIVADGTFVVSPPNGARAPGSDQTAGEALEVRT